MDGSMEGWMDLGKQECIRRAAPLRFVRKPTAALVWYHVENATTTHDDDDDDDDDDDERVMRVQSHCIPFPDIVPGKNDGDYGDGGDDSSSGDGGSSSSSSSSDSDGSGFVSRGCFSR